MDDARAYMELVRSNAQSELTALERGIHALGSKLGVREYARSVPQSPATTVFQRKAAEVFNQLNTSTDLAERATHLAEVHAAPSWLWPALVERLVGEGLTVEATRRAVADLKECPAPPEWSDAAAIAAAVVNREMTQAELGKLSLAYERALAAIDKAELNAETHKAALDEQIAKDRRSAVDLALTRLCHPHGRR